MNIEKKEVAEVRIKRIHGETIKEFSDVEVYANGKILHIIIGLTTYFVPIDMIDYLIIQDYKTNDTNNR